MAVARGLLPVSLELTPGAVLKSFKTCVDAMPKEDMLQIAGSRVFLPWLPGEDPALLVGSAEVVRQSGFLPVPHLVARSLHSRDQLLSLMHDLSSAHAAEEVLVLGGSLSTPAGPFAAASDLLHELSGRASSVQFSSATATAIDAHSRPAPPTVEPIVPFRRVYLAAHPSGHPALASHTITTRILADKVSLARQLNWKRERSRDAAPFATGSSGGEDRTSGKTPLPAAPEVAAVTQICFNFADIASTLHALSTLLPPAFTLPVFVGVLPPVSPARIAELVTKLALAPASLTLPPLPTPALLFNREEFLTDTLAAARANRAQLSGQPPAGGCEAPDGGLSISGRALVAGVHVYGLGTVKTVLHTATRLARQLTEE